MEEMIAEVDKDGDGQIDYEGVDLTLLYLAVLFDPCGP